MSSYSPQNGIVCGAAVLPFSSIQTKTRTVSSWSLIASTTGRKSVCTNRTSASAWLIV